MINLLSLLLSSVSVLDAEFDPASLLLISQYLCLLAAIPSVSRHVAVSRRGRLASLRRLSPLSGTVGSSTSTLVSTSTSSSDKFYSSISCEEMPYASPCSPSTSTASPPQQLQRFPVVVLSAPDDDNVLDSPQSPPFYVPSVTSHLRVARSAPPLQKSYSSPDSPPTMTTLRASHYRPRHMRSSSDVQDQYQPPHFRRVVSTSNADDSFTTATSGRTRSESERYTNDAGSSLRIPRRAISSNSNTQGLNLASNASGGVLDVSDEVFVGHEAGNGTIRGRGRMMKKSIFEIGSDDDRGKKAIKQAGSMAERQRRERTVSTDSSKPGGRNVEEANDGSNGRSITGAFTKESDTQNGGQKLEFALDTESEATESEDGASSGSECTTPTPASVARGRPRHHGDQLDPELESSTVGSVSAVDGAVESESSIPGIAPRIRRGVRGPFAHKGLDGLAVDVVVTEVCVVLLSWRSTGGPTQCYFSPSFTVLCIRWGLVPFF